MYEGVVKNNYLYQGAFAELDEELGWTDFPLRDYDAQIGRWVQQDPYQQFASPYVGMGADPANNTDPSGGIVPGGIGGLSTTAEKAITLGEVVVTSTSKALSIANKGLSLTSSISLLVRTVSLASNILNSNVASLQVGRPPYEYDQYGNKISNLGGNKINFYHQSDGNLKIEDAESGATNLIQNGSNYIKDYKQKNVSWTSVTLEFLFGTGYEKRLFSDFGGSGDGGAIKSLRSTYSSYGGKVRADIVQNSHLNKHMVSMNYLEANPFYARNMWEQMWGRTNISWYRLGDKVLFLMTDTKSFTSLSLRIGGSWERLGPLPIPMGTTSQTYIWTETISEIQEKNFRYQIYKNKQEAAAERSMWYLKNIELRSNKF